MNKRTSTGLIHSAILLVLVALFVAGPALAAPSQQDCGPIDPAELEAFLDDLITQQMEENHIAGATVAVVKDGELFFTKGYGYADLENQTPVVADQTLFSVGSLSKLFTWTAVLQLVEQGKVDLIMITSQGRGGMDPFLMISVAQRVVHLSDNPVFIIPINKELAE